MSTSLMLRILWRRSRLRVRERWTEEQLHSHQQRALAALRAFASSRSPYYARVYRHLDGAPLAELPVLTKADLMSSFDEIVTDRRLRLSDLEAYLAGNATGPFRGRYWVAATSGSSGRRSVIPTDAREWAAVIASYARANEWAGTRAGLRHRTRMAVVSSTTAWHQSSRVAASVQSPLVQSERIDAAAPLSEIVDRLNRMQPEVLVGYASMVRTLAAEQLGGHLRITPHAVNSSSEVLTTETRAMAVAAWGVAPFNVYAATETGGIAAECGRHGMHLFEDLLVPEVVDDDYRPVPTGETGSRLLVSVLSSRTIPLLRYEMTDRVRVSLRRCGCELPFRLLDGIEGRTDDLLNLPAASGAGTVQVHPVVFHHVLDLLDIAGWQVRQEPDGLRLLVARPAEKVHVDALGPMVAAALSAAGVARPQVQVVVVDTIPAGPAGKRPLVVAAGRSEPTPIEGRRGGSASPLPRPER